MTKYEAIAQLSENVEKIQTLIRDSQNLAQAHGLNFEFNSSRVGYSESINFNSSWESSSC